MTPARYCPHASSTARSFLRLAHRSCQFSTTAQPAVAPLDFLVPRSAVRCKGSTVAPLPFPRIETMLLRGHTRRALPRARSVAGSRSFSVSAVQQATVCVHNPVKDEDGKEMLLEITPRAAKRLSQIAAKDQNPNLALRISVESGGCHGFQYLMKLITIPQTDADAAAAELAEDDTIFQFNAESEGEGKDAAFDGARIVLDEPSLDLLKGSKVDFTQELIGSQFKITDNPFATSSCGCGTSFDVKM